MNAKELNHAPIGTRVIDVNEFVWIKTFNGRWENRSLGESATSAGVASYGVDLYIDQDLEDFFRTTTLEDLRK